MFVAGIAIDPRNRQPIVVLNDTAKRRALPIWIGQAEATAIGMALAQMKAERPMTHDLLLNTIKELQYSVRHVEINETQANIYFATITLRREGDDISIPREKNIDSRPSDAIALALRAGAPIYVAPKIFAENTVPIDMEEEERDNEEFKKFLEGVKASDFKLEERGEGEEEEASAEPEESTGWGGSGSEPSAPQSGSSSGRPRTYKASGRTSEEKEPPSGRKKKAPEKKASPEPKKPSAAPKKSSGSQKPVKTEKKGSGSKSTAAASKKTGTTKKKTSESKSKAGVKKSTASGGAKKPTEKKSTEKKSTAKKSTAKKPAAKDPSWAWA